MPNKKHKEKLNEKKVKIIGAISLLLGFAQSLLVYVESSYFKLSLGSDNVGLFYSIAYVIALVGLLNMHRIIKWIGKSIAFFLLFLVQILAIAMLMIVSPSLWGIVLMMTYIIASYLVLVVLDIILETYSEDKASGRIRGLHLTLINIGFLIGPMISTGVLEKYDYPGLFFATMVINMGIFLIALIGLRDGNKHFHGNLTVRDLVKKIFVNVDLMRIYWISFALEFFYALMIVYTPLYLLDLGFTWQQIGIMFTVMLIPFVLFGYAAGYLADRKFGEKEMIIGSLAIMLVSSATIFFITSPSLWLWAVILFSTRIGAAFIETLRDSYFYKRIDGEDMDLISFFRTARSFAYLFSTGISALFLVFFPVKSVFLLVAAVLFFSLYPAVRLVDSVALTEIRKTRRS